VLLKINVIEAQTEEVKNAEVLYFQHFSVKERFTPVKKEENTLLIKERRNT